MANAQRGGPPLKQMPASIKKWLKKHGVESVAEARGERVDAKARYVRAKSEMWNTLMSVEIESDKVILSDGVGWASEFHKDELDSHIKSHGKLSTWDSFQKLAGLKSKDVS